MAGVVCTEIGNFAFDPDIAVLTFDVRAHCRDQIAHDPHATFGGFEGEPQLIGKSHCEEFTGDGVQGRTACEHVGVPERRSGAAQTDYIPNVTASAGLCREPGAPRRPRTFPLAVSLPNAGLPL